MTSPLPNALRNPLASRVDAAYAPVVCAAHDEALTRQSDGYLDPLSGRFVFTAAYLWERGTCCNTGCRHCPYAKGTRYTSDSTDR